MNAKDVHDWEGLRFLSPLLVAGYGVYGLCPYGVGERRLEAYFGRLNLLV